MTPFGLRRHASLALLAGAGTCAALAQAAPDLFGEISFHRDNETYSAFANGSYHDERFFAGFVGSAETFQIGQLHIDLAAGTLRGVNSVEQLTGLHAQTTTTAWAFPEVQVVALPGTTPAPQVLLDLRVTLDGYFEVFNFTGQSTSAYSDFNATLALHFPGAAASRATASYDYDWLRTFSGDDFRHQKSASAAGCAGCFAEVLVDDPLDEYRNGFRNVTLRTTIGIEPGWLIVPDLLIRGRSIVTSHGAYGDWSNTARFGYVLPDGYALATGDGMLLDAWALQPVPEPGVPALLALGIAALALAVRRRCAG